MRPPAHCWHRTADGDVCDAELRVIDGKAGREHACPAGHRLRQWNDLSPHVRRHIELAQAEPMMHARFFEWRGDRLP